VLTEARASPDDPQIAATARVIRKVAPDGIINEVDDAPCNAARLLATRLGGDDAIVFEAPSFTGVATQHDLHGDGVAGSESCARANEPQGFGRVEGQDGLAVLTKRAIDPAALRTFQTFR
jgi:hypothetical protein